MLKFLEVQDLFSKVQGWSYKILYKVILLIFQHKHLNIPCSVLYQQCHGLYRCYFGQYKILVGWAVPEVTAASQNSDKIKASPAQVLFISPSWIHKVLYNKCAQSALSCPHIFPKLLFLCWKHLATFLCTRQAFSASSKICYNSTEDERNSFPKMCSQFFYPKHFLGLKTRMSIPILSKFASSYRFIYKAAIHRKPPENWGRKKIKGGNNEKLQTWVMSCSKGILQIWSLCKSLDLEHL